MRVLLRPILGFFSSITASSNRASAEILGAMQGFPAPDAALNEVTTKEFSSLAPKKTYHKTSTAVGAVKFPAQTLTGSITVKHIPQDYAAELFPAYQIIRSFSGKVLKPEELHTVIGSQEFERIRVKSTCFVDKTDFIKAWYLDGADVVLNTYPRRFMKSTNLDMINKFFNIEVDEKGSKLPKEERKYAKLFIGGEYEYEGKTYDLKPLKISTNYDAMRHQGEIPVITIDLKEIPGKSYKTTFRGLSSKVAEMYDSNKFLLKSSKISMEDKENIEKYSKPNLVLDDQEIADSIKYLSKYLHMHFGRKALILVDEYDSAINKSYFDINSSADNSQNIVDIYRNMLGAALKGNEHMDKGLVTGVLRLAKANIFSGLNNFTESGMGDESIAPYYGFTAEEVNELMIRYDIPEDLRDGIKYWYNGYKIGEYEIYNPWSVVGALGRYGRLAETSSYRGKEQVLQNYWQESGNLSFISPLLRHKDIRGKIDSLVNGKEITFIFKPQITSKEFGILKDILNGTQTTKITTYGINTFFSFLFQSGYLTYGTENYRFKFPNREAIDTFRSLVADYYEDLYSFDTKFIDEITNSLKLILESDKEAITIEKEKFVRNIKKLLVALPKFGKINKEMDSGEVEDILHGNEDLIHSLINYAAVRIPQLSRFGTEVPMGLGRADMVLIHKDSKKAIILEVKFEQGEMGALKGIDQIESRNYDDKIPKDYKIIKIGLNVDLDKNVKAEIQMPEESQENAKESGGFMVALASMIGLEIAEKAPDNSENSGDAVEGYENAKEQDTSVGSQEATSETTSILGQDE